ncbi:hypothetical protein A3Q29_22215 [Providencia stuartii]|uniref:Uncharacterized protein n=1 Tax=Providencia stuartii TaxID=588 RepID=A0A1S1HSG1_PROST|nr:hypothetical protein A3Q29_22220 [Providencia stuartii]OHT25350.1 hypothetical protein A3Q29_22215 [Providencia stuartii]
MSFANRRWQILTACRASLGQPRLTPENIFRRARGSDGKPHFRLIYLLFKGFYYASIAQGVATRRTSVIHWVIARIGAERADGGFVQCAGERQQ